MNWHLFTSLVAVLIALIGSVRSHMAARTAARIEDRLMQARIRIRENGQVLLDTTLERIRWFMERGDA